MYLRKYIERLKTYDQGLEADTVALEHTYRKAEVLRETQIRCGLGISSRLGAYQVVLIRLCFQMVGLDRHRRGSLCPSIEVLCHLAKACESIRRRKVL